MSLTKEDLGKIEALFNATLEVRLARIERRLELIEYKLVDIEQTMATKQQIENIKQMLTEDVIGAYHRIDELDARITALEKAI